MRATMCIAALLLLVASSASAQVETTVRADTIDHPTGTRMWAGFGMGFGVGFAALFTPGWAKSGLAGYFGGIVLGSAFVSAPKCGFVKRLGVSFAGTLAGSVISYFVASRTYLAKDGEAIAATIVVGGAPLVGSALALRSCDS
jgi:hypothetical protein